MLPPPPDYFLKLNDISRRHMPVEQRSEVLKALLHSIIENREAIKSAISADFRKPGPEIDFTEIIPVLSELRHALKNLRKWTKPQKAGRTLVHYNAKARIIHQPKGLVLIISPWNYPFNLTVGPLVSAIAAGNRVVLKPSEFTPNTSRFLKDFLGKAIPDDILHVEPGGAEVSQRLTSLPFHHIFFTGSPAIGRKVMLAASANLASVTLELGGKSPCLLDESYSKENFCSRIVWGKFINAGQTCIAPDYLLVPENRVQDIVDGLIHELEIRFPDKPSESNGDVSMTRIINQKHFQRLKGVYDDAISKGAKTVYGGQFREEDLFIKPTILTKISNNMRISEEEIFGPILPVVGYSDYNEAISYILNRPRPLATYLFTKNRGLIQQFQQNVQTGALVVNDVLSHYIHKNLPFGGANNSGIGRSHGFFGFKAFSNEMAYLETGPGPAGADIIKQPYSKKVNILIDKAVKYL